MCAQCRHMHTLPGASPASPPRTRRRLNPGKSEKGSSHDSRFHPSKPPSNAPKASTSGTDENTNPMCTSASPAFAVAAPVQLDTSLPVKNQPLRSFFGLPQKSVRFGTYSQKQTNEQNTTLLRIQRELLAPSRTPFARLSQEHREQVNDDRLWWEKVSSDEYRRMLRVGERSENLGKLKALVQGR